eukprot:9467437-Pyramimonas_sp.AAC.2
MAMTMMMMMMMMTTVMLMTSMMVMDDLSPKPSYSIDLPPSHARKGPRLQQRWLPILHRQQMPMLVH